MSEDRIIEKLKAFAEEDEIMELIDWLNNYANNEDISKRMNTFLETHAKSINDIYEPTNIMKRNMELREEVERLKKKKNKDDEVFKAMAEMIANKIED